MTLTKANKQALEMLKQTLSEYKSYKDYDDYFDNSISFLGHITRAKEPWGDMGIKYTAEQFKIDDPQTYNRCKRSFDKAVNENEFLTREDARNLLKLQEAGLIQCWKTRYGWKNIVKLLEEK